MMKKQLKNIEQFSEVTEQRSKKMEQCSKKIKQPSIIRITGLTRITGLILIMCMTLFSCDKFLEENPKDKLPAGDVYNKLSDVYLNAVASLYTYIGGYSDSQGLQGTGRGVYDLNTFTTDEAIIPTRGGDWYDGGFWQGLYLHDWGIENDAIQATWEYLYKVVMLSNKSLEIIDKFSETHSDAELPAYRAEVQAMRAMYYYYLMDLFARIPLVQSSSVAMKDVLQSDRKTVFEFIFRELQEAEPLLSDVHSNKSGPYYGRITRPVVTFLLAKLALNAEVYTDNDWTDTQRPDGKNIKFTVNGNELNAWETTVYYCDQLKSLGYKLEPEYETNFSVFNEPSVENVFTIPMNKTLYTNQMQYLFRYADALLMKSEAKVRNGENGDNELNEVRNRVNAAPRSATLENILAERQLELAWEGWRRQDLIRFGKFTRAYSSRPQLPDEASGYTTVFPIPEKIRVMNTNLKQNPGY